MENRQIAPFFSFLLFPLWLFVTFILVFGNSPNSFSCDPPLCSILVWNTSILGKSYPSGQPIILFEKVDIPRLLKSILCFVLREEQKKGISSWTSKERNAKKKTWFFSLLGFSSKSNSQSKENWYERTTW